MKTNQSQNCFPFHGPWIAGCRGGPLASGALRRTGQPQAADGTGAAGAVMVFQVAVVFFSRHGRLVTTANVIAEGARKVHACPSRRQPAAAVACGRACGPANGICGGRRVLHGDRAAHHRRQCDCCWRTEGWALGVCMGAALWPDRLSQGRAWVFCSASRQVLCYSRPAQDSGFAQKQSKARCGCAGLASWLPDAAAGGCRSPARR